jgi:homoserine O-acetyltransferase
MTHACAAAAIAAFAGAGVVLAAQTPTPAPDPHRRLFALGDFRLESGVVLPNATLAYATFGALNERRDNAILVPSWYGADHHGYDFLIGPGLALDPSKYFVVATEMFANGFSSSPSNTPAPFDRSRFPAIAIRDNVVAARRVLTEALHVDHLRAVVGFSMGAQQAFQRFRRCGGRLLRDREDVSARRGPARERDFGADRRRGVQER